MEFNYMKYANETGYRQRQKLVKLHQTEGFDLKFNYKILKNPTYSKSVIYTRYVSFDAVPFFGHGAFFDKNFKKYGQKRHTRCTMGHIDNQE